MYESNIFVSFLFVEENAQLFFFLLKTGLFRYQKCTKLTLPITITRNHCLSV